MINQIWSTMIISGVVFAAFNGNLTEVATAFLSSAQDSINLLIQLAGPMLFWLGMMNIAKESGLINLLSRLVRPVVKSLFPKIPADHPALGAIIMNFSANLFGLGNSATPLGIKAMEELQKLNPKPNRPSDAICTFLIINTSGLTLIPGTILSLRVGAGSLNPGEIILTTVFATGCATVAGVVSNKIILSLSRDKDV